MRTLFLFNNENHETISVPSEKLLQWCIEHHPKEVYLDITTQGLIEIISRHYGQVFRCELGQWKGRIINMKNENFDFEDSFYKRHPNFPLYLAIAALIASICMPILRAILE